MMYSDSEANLDGLTLAVCGGKLERVREIISSCKPSHLESKHSLLIDAVGQDQADVVRLLLENGFKVNVQNEVMKETPLHIAVTNNNFEIVKMLLENGAHVSAQDFWGETPLLRAVNLNKISVVELLLQYNANVEYTYNSMCLKKYCTPLHCAVINGHNQIVKVLLEYGANPNVQHRSGNTILHFAVLYSNSVIVKLLLNHGAGIYPANDWNKNYELLYDAAIRGQLPVIELLLNHGLNVNKRYRLKAGCTILHAAAKYYYEDSAKLAISHGADVNIKDDCERPPILNAIENCDVKITQLMLEHGANTKNSPELLITAVKYEFEEIVELLLNYRVDINAKEKSGATALHVAVQKNSVSITKLLLSNGANVDALKDNGITPLCYAENEQVFETLLEHGADINLVDFEHICHMLGTISACFKYQIYRMMAADLFIAYSNKSTILELHGSDESYYEKCTKEIISMKTEKIPNANLSIYDILHKKINQLAILLRNENIVQVFKSGDYKSNFPIYSNMLSSCFRKGLRRKNLIDGSSKHTNIFQQLLPDCIGEIFDYLSDADLKNFIDACEHLSSDRKR